MKTHTDMNTRETFFSPWHIKRLVFLSVVDAHTQKLTSLYWLRLCGGGRGFGSAAENGAGGRQLASAARNESVVFVSMF